MSTTQELEQLLVKLVDEWPSDQEVPAVQAARDYLCLNRGIEVLNSGHAGFHGDSSYEIQFDDLTASWYAV